MGGRGVLLFSAEEEGCGKSRGPKANRGSRASGKAEEAEGSGVEVEENGPKERGVVAGVSAGGGVGEVGVGGRGVSGPRAMRGQADSGR